MEQSPRHEGDLSLNPEHMTILKAILECEMMKSKEGQQEVDIDTVER